MSSLFVEYPNVEKPALPRRRDPFRITPPAYLAFSGGRTSGLLLRRILDAFGGQLPPDLLVLFANTGREYEETLAFVNECSLRWQVPIRWLEYRRDPEAPVVTWKGRRAMIGCHSFTEVSYETASRNGEPFEEAVQVRAAFRKLVKDEEAVLPNPVQRFCSGELKQRTMERFARAQGWGSFSALVGLRSDEPGRVSKLRAQSNDEIDYLCPLYDAEITEADVLQFWGDQPFDLGLVNDPVLGTYQGNCDLCFLKRIPKIVRLAAESPERLEWWAAMEQRTGQNFRKDRFTYSRLLAGQVPLAMLGEDLGDETTCLCTD